MQYNLSRYLQDMNCTYIGGTCCIVCHLTMPCAACSDSPDFPDCCSSEAADSMQCFAEAMETWTIVPRSTDRFQWELSK
jgi:hypothetical protein